MSQTADHYLIFETAGGFCGIAWNKVGITRFQLPTRSTEATERVLRRRIPGAEPGAPTPEVVEAVAAVRRYFEGEEVDFSGFRLDLGEQDAFFKRIYAAGAAGWMGPHDHLWRSGEGTRRRARGRARCRSSHGRESGGADHPLPQGLGGRRQGWWFFRARRLGGQDPHARAGGRSGRATATGSAVFWVLAWRRDIGAVTDLCLTC